MTEKRILGLDPGLATLGFGIIDVTDQNVRGVNPLTMVDFGIIQTPAKTEISQRLQIIYDDLSNIVDEFQPNLVAIEKFFFYRMANTIAVAQARGIVLLVLAQHQLTYLEFTPAQIKQAITGYGNAQKDEVQAAVARELALDYIPKPDDAADALAIAITGWMNL